MKNTNLFRLAFLLFAGLSIFLSSCQPKEEGDKKYVIGFSCCVFLNNTYIRRPEEKKQDAFSGKNERQGVSGLCATLW